MPASLRHRVALDGGAVRVETVPMFGQWIRRRGEDIGQAYPAQREAADAVQAFYALDRGSLTIGASTTIATYWLPPLVAAFQRDHPAVDIHLKSGNTQHVAQWLLDCSIDVALVEGPVVDERLESRPWRSEEMLIVIPRSEAPAKPTPVPAHRLANRLWVLREPGSGSREVAERSLARLGIEMRQTLEVGSNEAIVQTVAAGLGIGIVPAICAQDAIALGRIASLKIKGEDIQRELYRLRLPRRPVSQVALAFEALLAQA